MAKQKQREHKSPQIQALEQLNKAKNPFTVAAILSAIILFVFEIAPFPKTEISWGVTLIIIALIMIFGLVLHLADPKGKKND